MILRGITLFLYYDLGRRRALENKKIVIFHPLEKL